MGRFWLLAILPFFAAACGARDSGSVQPCEDCGFMVNSAGQIMAWPDGVAMSFKLAQDFSSDSGVKGAVLQAATAINVSLQRTSITIADASAAAPAFNTNTAAASADGINTIYWVTGTWPWASSDGATQQAITLVSMGESQVVSADIYFKASSFGPANGVVFTADELKRLQLIALHELGHALGRIHTKYPGSIMNSQVFATIHSTSLVAYDLQIFERAYSLRDSALQIIASSGLKGFSLTGLFSQDAQAESGDENVYDLAWRSRSMDGESSSGLSFDPRAVRNVLSFE